MSSGTKNKRILVVCQHFWPESFRINDITDYLLDKEYEVDVLCGRPNYPSGELAQGYTLWNKRIEKYKGATIYRSFELPRGDNSNMRIFLNYISFPIFSLFLTPKLMLKKYDQILIYQLSPVMMAIAGILIGKIRKTPTTMYVLDLWPENLFSVLNIQNKILRSLITRISHWHYRHADKLIALSETMQQKLLEITRKTNDSVIVLPQAAEKLYEIPLKDSSIENRFKDTFNIVFTGNISPAQSFSTMIQAAQILKDKGLKNMRWIIVGDGMSRHEVKNDIKSKNLDDTFVFEGQKPVGDIPKYTNIANILVGCLVKSDLLEATIPAKVMSYIASGKPIVLAMDGEVQQLINDEIRCGYAGPTESATILAENIENIYLSSLEQREEMGQRAKAYHLEHFERSIILNKMHDFMFDLN